MRFGVIALLLAAGCSDANITATETEERRTLDSKLSQLVMGDGPSLTLRHDGTDLLVFSADAFILGLIDAVDDDSNYDPFRLYEPNPLYDYPEELAFVSPSSAKFTAESTLEISYGDDVTATLAAEVSETGFKLVWTADGSRAAYMRVRPLANAEEGFYGLGEYFDSVSHRGKVRAMQIEGGGPLESGNNEAHVPVPFIIGTSGWGMFIESPHPATFAVALDDDSAIEATFGTGLASSDGLPLHLMTSADPMLLTGKYLSISGMPKAPAPWALGPLIWRDENDSQAQVESDLDMIRDLDLATTGLWIDRPYATGVNTFDFDAAKFPDPPAMIAKMHDLGFRVGLWHTPYLDDEDPSTADLRAEAEAGGYYPLESAINLNGWGTPIDLTKPEAKAFWQDNLQRYIDMGIEGFKLDYGEDVINGLFANRTPWTFADGSDERTMHSQFTRVYHETYAEMLPQDGYFLLCRAGTYGDQVNAPIIWPGDLDASFARQGETAEDNNGDPYVAVGGLLGSIIAGNSLGPSGFPFYGSDTGGYRHSPTDKELFMRWFEQTALSTVMQIGTSANDVAWELGGSNGFDQELLDSYRFYVRLHLRLFPYLWHHVELATTLGLPIQRPLGLMYPELGVHPDDHYMLGGALLVAPVVDRGATDKDVIFPDGEWVHWISGERFSGGSTQTVAAPLGRLPVFLRVGELVPMLRPTIDTLSPTTDPVRVDSYASDHGVLYIRAVAGAAAEMSLFGQALSVDAGSVSFEAGATFDQGAIFELVDADAPNTGLPELSDVDALEAAQEGYVYDATSRTLWVRTMATAQI